GIENAKHVVIRAPESVALPFAAVAFNCVYCTNACQQRSVWSSAQPACHGQCTLRSTLHPSDSILTAVQILFLIGLTLIIGFQKTMVFFSRPQKLKGTAAFTAGIILILLRWPLTGFLIELYGLFILFGDFLVTIGQFAGNIPVVGPYIQRGLEILAGGRSNAELPV
ncbi:hypothetical protein N7474_002239, partial [Penicillium riverlandense]|uniref:uncharacterized protein n=1 Tax=Penicillium riverlandense TaxID=1903569 RepID=UPI0025489961